MAATVILKNNLQQKILPNSKHFPSLTSTLLPVASTEQHNNQQLLNYTTVNNHSPAWCHYNNCPPIGLLNTPN